MLVRALIAVCIALAAALAFQSFRAIEAESRASTFEKALIRANDTLARLKTGANAAAKAAASDENAEEIARQNDGAWQ